MIKKETIKIGGMHCASCASNITKNLAKMEGVVDSKVNFATETAKVEFDGSKANLEEIKKTIVNTGYKIIEQEEQEKAKSEELKHEKRLKLKVIFSILLTLPIFLRMFWKWEIPGELWGVPFTDWAQHDLAFLVVFIFGWQFHANTFKQLFKKQLGMDALISMGTLAAYFYSLWSMFFGGHIYFESAATITTLILLGRFLETKTKSRASQAMRKLLELGVKKANVLVSEGKEIEKNIEDIRIGEIIVVRPGEKVPLDGEVLEGISYINESMLSGESMPVLKEKRSEVYGATINQDGILKIKVSAEAGDTMLSQIIKTVEEAQSSKPPMQRLADKIAGIFVPAVICIAVLTFAGWMIASGDVSKALINAVAVLIISCPCALGIATPIAVMVGASVGAQNGILIKNGDSFEKVKKIDTVIFDKTGTLTKGEPKVRRVIANKEESFSEDKIIKIGASVAKGSRHPLSQAVVLYAEEEKIDLTEISGFKEIPGKGVSGKCTTHKTDLFLGNKKLLKENNFDISWPERITKEHREAGGTLLFVAHGDKVIGAILATDEIKESSADTIKELNKMGMETIILSGDNKPNAEATAGSLGVKKVLAEVLPAEKQFEVKNLQKDGRKVIFVGDGINDAPSLVQADLGIAIGSGADIAKESGDIILTQSDPYKVVRAINLSAKTFKIIKQNLFWAFFYNVLAIPLAVAGLVNPMVGAMAMGLSDVFVISNSLRIYRK
ncbi:heavy metal translocating P-type ATPase [Candidatus Falkowbacteria bacterium]|nr:heavy metal translocating P-type ATPase [Candidatus Falkowbacteria bacterium]